MERAEKQSLPRQKRVRARRKDVGGGVNALCQNLLAPRSLIQGCQMAKFDPFLSFCAPTPSTLAQSKERKGSNFAA